MSIYILKFNINMFTNPIRTTISIEGKFTNLNNLHENMINKYQPEGNILCFESNYGRNIIKKYEDTLPKKNKNKKKINVCKYKRKKQGNGTQMSSQIQVHIRSHWSKEKIYKIKSFRKGTFGVPGIKKKDYSDVMPALEILRDYHRKVHSNNSIEIHPNIFPILVNYKWQLKNRNLIFELQNIIDEIASYKLNNTEQNIIFKILDKSPKLNKNMANIIKKYIPVNRFDISELKLNREKVSSGISIKFRRPAIRIKNKKHLNAKSTLKIFQSGKVNLDAVKSLEEAHDLYDWLDNFIQIRYDKLIYDTSISSSDSSDFLEDFSSDDDIFND